MKNMECRQKVLAITARKTVTASMPVIFGIFGSDSGGKKYRRQETR